MIPEIIILEIEIRLSLIQVRKVTKELIQEIVKEKTKWEHTSNYFLTTHRKIFKMKNLMELVGIKIIK